MVDTHLQKLVEDVMEAYLPKLRDACVEQLLVLLPGIVTHLVRQTADTEKAVRTFYGAHPEYIPHSDIVTQLVEKYEALSPGRDTGAVLEDVEREMKQVLHKQQLVLGSSSAHSQNANGVL